MRVIAGTIEGDAHYVYCNGARVIKAIEADTQKGYVIEINHDKGAYDAKYANHVRKLTGKVELVHRFTGVVVQ